MPIVIKNAQIQRAVEYEVRNQVKTKSVREGAEIFRRSTEEEIGMNMLWGYVSSLVEISGFPELAKPLDLSYGTLSRLIDVLSYQYLIGPNAGYTPDFNLETAEKACAAYLIFLAANEHGFHISVKRKEDPRPAEGDAGELWAGFEIRVGHTLYTADLLKAVHGRIVPGEGTLSFDLEELTGVYGLLTGKDLKEYGLKSVTVHFGSGG